MLGAVTVAGTRIAGARESPTRLPVAARGDAPLSMT